RRAVRGVAHGEEGRREASELDEELGTGNPRMKLAGKVVVVTGGGNGIGRALCRRFAAERAKAIVVADLNGAAARQVADEIGGTAVDADVSREADVVALVTQTIARHGWIDLFCSNAGIAVNGD